MLKKILIFTFIILMGKISFSQSIHFVKPSNGETITYTAYRATETTIPVNVYFNYTNSTYPPVM